VAAGWFGAAVLAVLVGLAAISVIGAGLMSSSGTQPRSEAEVAREVAALPAPSPSPSATESLGTSPTSAAPRSFATRAGTLVAACSAAGAEIISMAPAAGFTVHEQTHGAQRQAEGEFRGTSDDKDRVKITVTCPGGAPSMSVRDRRD
jgi:hypothetical protein